MPTVKDPAQTMIDNLPEKTGKSLAQWHTALKKAGLTPESKHGEIMKLLKGEFAISHGFANLIALKFRAQGTVDEVDLVAAQYLGKEALKPIYDKLVNAINKFGKDVELAPKKTYVSLRRSEQFGLIQPSTKDRLDLGINLKGVNASGRLEASGSFNAMVSHRVRLTEAKQVDKELIAWLKAAYQQA